MQELILEHNPELDSNFNYSLRVTYGKTGLFPYKVEYLPTFFKGKINLPPIGLYAMAIQLKPEQNINRCSYCHGFYFY